MIEIAHSLARSDHPPIQQLQTVADRLETPALARLYAYILRNDSVTVADIVANLGIPQGTAYGYV